MSARRRSSLLWGLVGTLTFLVLVQGYALVGSPLVGPVPTATMALLVGVVVAGVAYVAEPRIERKRLND